MKATTTSFSLLIERGRWKVEFFLPDDGENDSPSLSSSSFVPLRSLVKERKETINPSSLRATLINYIGLEHIQTFTGELVGHGPRPASSIKSRSKIFRPNDVLFGRLRPSLNKVWLARGDVIEGICSTEFFVLVPIVERVRPGVLRYLLSSPYVQRHASRLQTGTALPRMDLNDLLEIQVPLPDLDTQVTLERRVLREFDELVTLRARLEMMPQEIQQHFMEGVEI